MLEAVFLMLPALTAVIYQEFHCILVFLGSAVFCLAAGALLRGKKPENTTIFSAEGYVSVALCWVALSLCGAIPLYFSGFFPNPVDALFEIVSGFTTTGSSVLLDVGRRYGGSGFHVGASPYGRRFQYAFDEGGEPRSICW